MTETPTPGDEAPVFIDAEPAQPIGASDRPSRGDRARSAAYSSRFTIVYITLALVAGIGVGAFVVQMGRPDPAPPARWSNWEPTGSETAQARQIANRVAKSYRLEGGQQLAAAIVSPPRITSGDGDVPVSTIAIRPDTSTGQNEEGEFDVIPTDKSLQFVLCGLGTGCSIASGAPSEGRQALLRREALELALYTFKYVDGIESVSVFLPPRPDGEAAPTSVFLKRSDVSSMLRKPLYATIAPKTPTVGTMPQREIDLVDQLTLPRLYSFDVQRAQDGSAVLVYDPVVLGA
ncbi:hypothetical protein [Gaiella sp.]|uniref:hypothetical protein n=1 Tax=Gaiella sp. TaxID=2663207 RepID=UPI003263A0E7